MTMTLPAGAYWSNNVTVNPAISLEAFPRETMPFLPAGEYQFAVVPMGDNLCVGPMSPVFTTTLNRPSNVAFRPRFPLREPSSGYLMLSKLATDTDWKIGGLPSGQSYYKRMPFPIYAHGGHRYNNFKFNGLPWYTSQQPGLNDGYYNVGPAFGALRKDLVNRMPLSAPEFAPDISIISDVENIPVYVSISFVDFLGRETGLLPILTLPARPDLESSLGTVVQFVRRYAVPMQCAGVYVYAGFSTDTMTRQPLLDREAAPGESLEPEYLWPRHLSTYVLNKIVNSGIYNAPSEVVASPFNAIQKRLEAGDWRISYDQSSYNQYGPMVLPYNGSFPWGYDRVIGTDWEYAEFIHKTDCGGIPLVTAKSELVVVESYCDRLRNARFISQTSLAALASNDYSGGQAFSFLAESCRFRTDSPEGIGIEVNDASSAGSGSHTASEWRVKNCEISAANPIKVEGNQTGMFAFTDYCEFGGNGSNSRYPADTAALIYHCAPAHMLFRDVKGVNGLQRSLAILGGNNASTLLIDTIFVDAGINVFFTFQGIYGGDVTLSGMGAINSPDSLEWVRKTEAPIGLRVRVRTKNIRYDHKNSSISFLLNQLLTESDREDAQVVTMTPGLWQQKGIPVVNDQGWDWSIKQQGVYQYGDAAIADGIALLTPNDLIQSP